MWEGKFRTPPPQLWHPLTDSPETQIMIICASSGYYNNTAEHFPLKPTSYFYNTAVRRDHSLSSRIQWQESWRMERRWTFRRQSHTPLCQWPVLASCRSRNWPWRPTADTSDQNQYLPSTYFIHFIASLHAKLRKLCMARYCITGDAILSVYLPQRQHTGRFLSYNSAV